MKRGLKGLLILLLVSLSLLVVVYAISLSSSFSTMSPSAYKNLSRTTQLNLTLIDNRSNNDASNVTNVTFMFSNMTNKWIYNTTIENTTMGQHNFSNNSFNTALLADGVYNITVNITNSSKAGLSSALNESDVTCGGCGYNITIDNTPPAVTQNLTGSTTSGTSMAIANGTNLSASRGNISINFTIVDSRPAQTSDGLYTQNHWNISNVMVVFSNGTGADFNLSNINQSGANKGLVENRSGVWTINYNLSSLAEEPQGITIYANDTFNNTRVVSINFTIDRTAPVMLTLATSSVGTDTAKVSLTANESLANCTYSSVAGAQGSAGSGNLSVTTPGTLTGYTKTFSGLTAGTGYNIEITCTDFVGYTVTNALSWSTTAAAASSSSGGSGSGGSGGGISSGVQGQTAKEVWNSINAGETASVEVKNGAIGVTEVSFTVPQTVYGAWVQVAKKDSLPSTVSSFSGKVYRNLEISKGPALNKEGSFTDATIEFKVEKAWLTEKGLGKEAVALHRYVDGKWVELSTTVGEDDGTYVHYTAKTPGFSYFVIGEKSGASAPAASDLAPEQPATAEPTEQPAVEAPAVEEPATVEKQGMSKGLLLALLAAAVVVAVVLYMRKRR